ncbi:MAG: hypothetical protein OEQ28_03705 [Acidobacteriota bacterium]|nr:hypothetical protein [Acidobacteriota bacterium]
MILSLLLILTITAGGFGLTYILESERTFLWRLAAGSVIGSAIFGVVCFFLSVLAGLNFFTIIIAAGLAFLPVLCVRSGHHKKLFRHDWDKAKGRIERFTVGRAKNFAYYVFFLVLVAAFFDRAMIVTAEGIFTGASNNLGDLPFHLGAIYSFTDGNNFPPENPSFADVRFTYPFIADFLSAVFVKLGMTVRGAMLLPNVIWALSLLIILEQFAAAVSKSRMAGKIAPFILFLSGGLGFLWFFWDYWQGARGIFEILWNLPEDYTIGDKFRWGNSLVVLFVTQRSILLGMPLTLIVIHHLWGLISRRNPEIEKDKKSGPPATGVVSSFCLGLIAGTLPLIHAHSLLVLFVLGAFLFVSDLKNWKNWFSFAAGTGIVGGCLLGWMLIGSATGTSEFAAWHFGFDARGQNIFWFWLKNAGLFIPVAVAGLAIRALIPAKREDETADSEIRFSAAHLLFALPFIVIFIVSNVAKFAPWEWDNIKLLIYSFVGLIPFASYFLVWVWKKGRLFRALAGITFAVLIASGALDVWRTVSGQIEYELYNQETVKVAKEIRERTKPDALFLNAPTYNTAVVLTGRRSLMRYTGHLSSHGIDYKPREADLMRIYRGDATADLLLRKYGIDYVLVSPLERQSLQVNEEFFKRYQLFLEAGEFRVYKIADK